MASGTTALPDGPRRGPLRSLKVLDFTALIPGPLATLTLADLGADVVRVESPNRPDTVRLFPPYDGDASVWHRVLNRNKRSLALDLKRPEATAVVKHLIATGGYEIVIEQFRPGVMDRLGLGYETLRDINPALIYCAITGYGQTGPLRDAAGHDINFLALSGVMSHSGRAGERPPLLGVQVADVGGGTAGALVGLLAAVVERQLSGKGQFVDISMFDMIVAWQSHIAAEYLAAGQRPKPEAAMLNGGWRYDYYETSDGRYLAMAALEPKFWQGFCELVERPDLVAPGLDPTLESQAAVRQELEQLFIRRTLDEWTAVFAGSDVCVEPVLTIPEMVTHPHTEARGLVVDVPHGDDAQPQIASPYRFSRHEAEYRYAGGGLGEHTEEVLREAGYSAADIASLQDAGAFG